MSEPLTILMPVKNGMPYIEDTLASIAAQTYPNFRLLVWDNGSTDGTVDILKQWVPHRIPGDVVTDRPLPLGKCRRQMVFQTETELIAMADADDIHLPSRLARQVDYMTAHPECGLLGTNVECVDDQTNVLDHQFTLPCEDAEIRWRQLFANAVMQCGAMMRRSAVLEAGNYRHMQPGQDYDLMLRMVPVTKMANLSERLVKYRIRNNSISHNGAPAGEKMTRGLFARYLATLLPGVDRESTITMHRKLTRDYADRATLTDLRALRRAAEALAQATGESPRYFRATRRFAHQWSNLRTRWIKSLPGARRAWSSMQTMRNRVVGTSDQRRAA